MRAVAAQALPGLSTRAMQTLTARAPCPVATYRSICAGTLALDLREDSAEAVRRQFNGYYGVRRNTGWRQRFYACFEAAKSSDKNGRDLFVEVIEGMYRDTGRVEASFASKLVATLRPEFPIIDSVVRKWLSTHGTTPPFKGGAEGVIAYYAWLCDVMQDLSQSPEAQYWGAVFEAAFPAPEGQAPIAAMKRLDFLIWAGADR